MRERFRVLAAQEATRHRVPCPCLRVIAGLVETAPDGLAGAGFLGRLCDWHRYTEWLLEHSPTDLADMARGRAAPNWREIVMHVESGRQPAHGCRF